MKKILFISHEASRSGAPIVLLHFLRWLKANTNTPFKILFKNGGELESEFKAIAPVLFYTKMVPKTGLVGWGLRGLDLDIDDMAKRIVDLLNSSELRQRLGQRAKQKVRERHDVERVAPKILNAINKFR